MLGRVGTVLEMINTRKIGVSTLLTSIQRFDAIDVTGLGKS
jgi:hypothetical protein